MPSRRDDPAGTDPGKNDLLITDELRREYDDLLARMQRAEHREAVTRALAATSEEMGRAAVEWAEIEQAMREIRADIARSAGAKMSEADLLAAARAAVAERRARSPRQGGSG